MTEDLVQRLRKRAEIRRQITTRKSVQNNEPDRISDLLEEAANHIGIAEAIGFDKGHKAATAKTLTDDELFKVYVDLQENYTGDNFPVDLGRAILRKAQEK
jgi:hypothetical protein